MLIGLLCSNYCLSGDRAYKILTVAVILMVNIVVVKVLYIYYITIGLPVVALVVYTCIGSILFLLFNGG